MRARRWVWWGRAEPAFKQAINRTLLWMAGQVPCVGKGCKEGAKTAAPFSMLLERTSRFAVFASTNAWVTDFLRLSEWVGLYGNFSNDLEDGKGETRQTRLGRSWQGLASEQRLCGVFGKAPRPLNTKTRTRGELLSADALFELTGFSVALLTERVVKRSVIQKIKDFFKGKEKLETDHVRCKNNRQTPFCSDAPAAPQDKKEQN